MPSYTPPLRDMQFVMHEVLHVVEDFKAIPKHADIDAQTINAILEEAGKFASQVTLPLNILIFRVLRKRKCWKQPFCP